MGRAVGCRAALPLLLIVLLDLAPLVTGGGAPVYEYSFRGYAVVYRRLEVPDPVHYYVFVDDNVSLPVSPEGMLPDGSRFRLRLVASCLGLLERPFKPYYTVSEETGSGGPYKLITVYYPSECLPVRIPLIWEVWGRVRVHDLNASFAEILLVLRLNLATVVEPVEGFGAASGPPWDAVNLTLRYRFLVDKSRNLLYLNGTLLGFNPLYIYYPRNLEEYEEWNRTRLPYKYMGMGLHLYLDDPYRPSYICGAVNHLFTRAFHEAFQEFVSGRLLLNYTLPVPAELASLKPRDALQGLAAMTMEKLEGEGLERGLRWLLEILANDTYTVVLSQPLTQLTYPRLQKPLVAPPRPRDPFYTNIVCYKDHYPLATGMSDLEFNLILPLPGPMTCCFNARLLQVNIVSVNHTATIPPLAQPTTTPVGQEPPKLHSLATTAAILALTFFLALYAAGRVRRADR